jgi:hypothetical protein
VKTFVPIMSKNSAFWELASSWRAGHTQRPAYSLARRGLPGRCDLYCDRLSVPSALAGSVQLRADSIPSRCYIITVQNQPP